MTVVTSANEYDGGAEGEVLLMDDSGFQLRRVTPFAEQRYNLHSYIAHMCPSSRMWRFWWDLMIIDQACLYCGEYPPEDMMGLWKLHNFEWIQSNGVVK